MNNQNIPLFELKKIQSEFPKTKISSAEEAATFIRQFYDTDIEIFESVFILLLNNSNITIGYAKISQGGITGTVVDPRIVAKYAVDSLATSVIICHNHPSGGLKPSRADELMTERLKEGLRFLEINLADHIILTATDHFSFAVEGLL